jgi:hypothetical protein
MRFKIQIVISPWRKIEKRVGEAKKESHKVPFAHTRRQRYEREIWD